VGWARGRKPGRADRWCARCHAALTALCISYLLDSDAFCLSYPKGVERVELVGRRNLDAKRKRRVQKGVWG